ncbi:MAG: small basic family protein [Clostridiaceae bacterium]|nr:small basic family protein [Clostridiaceae bacterium]
MIPLLGLLAGLLLGLFLDFDIPQQYSTYVALGILAVLDSIIGALRANLQGTFNVVLFATGLLGNTLVAILLAALGDQLDIQLDLAAVFAFGNRIFVNVSLIRRFLVERAENARKKRDAETL